LISISISLLLNRSLLRLAPRLGLMDQPGERRIHLMAIPRIGGIAIWVTFLCVTGGAVLLGPMDVSGHLSWTWLRAFTAGSLVLMVAGFFDDRSGLPPLVKLGAHFLAPTVFYLLHPIQTGFFPADWSPFFDYGVFVIWAVVLINAFNLIDGLDGLCGGLALVSALTLASIAFVNQRADSAFLLLVMAGAIVGFLRYNINPARIFLGDAGSMLIGFFLATAATDAVGRKVVVGAILLPIAIAGVPLLDVLLAIWRRSAKKFVKQLQGQATAGGIMAADADHLHHRLLASGGSQHKVAMVLHGIAILLAVLAFLPMLFGNRVMALSLVGLLVIVLVGIRNLARLEIEYTGSVIHLAIKLGSRWRRVAAALFLYDFLVLCASGVVAVLIETSGLARGQNVDDLAKFVVVYTVLGCIATLVVKVHHRLWVRATMRDILALQFWLMVAALGTFALFGFVYVSLEWSALRLAIISYVLGCIGLCLPRITLDLLREFALEARYRNPKVAGHGERGSVVILGAGDLGTLLLDHLKSSSHDLYPGMKVLGFIDEFGVLHGRRLRSFRILGGLECIPDLVTNANLKGIILAIRNPSDELLLQIELLAEKYQLKIFRWNVEIAEFSGKS
jgi:UDP-GlcNAc:undecaprenyl-phosphate/decaprenyl-phosphate GlcNAc-1-phosphate transferase